MGHPPNSKNKYKKKQKEIAQLGRLLQQFANLVLIVDSDIKDLKAQLLSKGIIDKEEETPVEPEAASEADYFPTKADESISAE